METAEHREPYKPRGSRTDLGAPRGESPRATRHLRPYAAWSATGCRAPLAAVPPSRIERIEPTPYGGRYSRDSPAFGLDVTRSRRCRGQYARTPPQSLYPTRSDRHYGIPNSEHCGPDAASR